MKSIFLSIALAGLSFSASALPISQEPVAATVSTNDDLMVNTTNAGFGSWTTKRATVGKVVAGALPLIRPDMTNAALGVANTVGNGVLAALATNRAVLPPTSVLATEPNTMPLIIPTFDGPLRTTHPSIIDAGPSGWSGHRYWLCHTPYPVYTRELPSLVYSDDMVNWSQVGINNPIFTWAEAQTISTQIGGGINGYWSDGEIFTNGANLVMVGRFFQEGGGKVRWYVKTSADGINWSGLTLVWSAPVSCEAASPQVVDTGTALRWYFEYGTLYAMESDYNYSNFTTPINTGLPIWHFDVKRASNGYWVIGTQGYGGQDMKRLIWATSSTGLGPWQVQSTDLIPPTGYLFDSHGWYKPDFIINSVSPPSITLFAGSAYVGNDDAWRIALFRNITIPVSLSSSNYVGPLSLNPASVTAGSARISTALIDRLQRGASAQSLPVGSNVFLPFNGSDFTTIQCPTNSNFILTNVVGAPDIMEERRFLLDAQGVTVSATFPPDWQWSTAPGTSLVIPTNFGGLTNVLLQVQMVGSNVFARGSLTIVPMDPDAGAFITAAGITNWTQQAAVSHLVTDLKLNGSPSFWSREQLIYPFVGGSSGAHAVNLRSPGTYDITWHGGVTHDALGVQGDGTTGYGDTGYTWSGVTSSNIRLFVYVQNDSPLSTAGAYLGSSDGTHRIFLRHENVDGVSYSIADATTGSGVMGASKHNAGPWILERNDDAANRLLAFNGGNFSSFAVAATGLNAINLWVLAYDNNNSPNEVGPARLCGISVGSAFSQEEWATYAAIWDRFEAALNRKP